MNSSFRQSIAAFVFLTTVLLLPHTMLHAVASAQTTDYATPTPVIAPSTATPTTVDDGDLPVNPFPATGALTDTIQVVAASLAQGQNGQSAPLPAATLLDDGPQLQAALAATYRVYLPTVRRAQGATAPTPTPKPTTPPDHHDESADVGVGIWPNPSVQVARNGTIAYDIHVTNYGDGEADSVRVTLPQNPALMQVYGSTIPGKSDWVSEKTTTAVTLTFGPFGKGEQRTATLFFRLKTGLADGTIIPMRASYTWGNSDTNGVSTTNAAPVRVGPQDERSAWGVFDTTPKTARVGTTHQFASDRFAPGEGVSYWMNLPNGTTKAVDNQSVADKNGFTSTTFRSSGLVPGAYSLVGQGQRSGVIVVGFFTVTQ